MHFKLKIVHTNKDELRNTNETLFNFKKTVKPFSVCTRKLNHAGLGGSWGHPLVLAGVRLCWMRSCQTLLASRWHFCADGGKKRVERSLVEPGESGACQDCCEPTACHLAGRDSLQFCHCDGQVAHCWKWPATGRRDGVVDDLRVSARDASSRAPGGASLAHCMAGYPASAAGTWTGTQNREGALSLWQPQRTQALQLGPRDGGGRVGV